MLFFFERKTRCGRSFKPRFRKKSHLGGGIKKTAPVGCCSFLERKTRLEPTGVGDLALFLSPPTPSRGMWSLVRAIVFNRRRKQKATHAGNNEVPQGPRLQGALCLVRGYTMQVFRRKRPLNKNSTLMSAVFI